MLTMVENQRITIRLPSDTMQKLEELVASGKYENKSDVIRQAIDSLIDEKVTPPNIEKITVELPKGNVIKLEELVTSGDSVSINDAIRDAVREYTKARFEMMLKEYQEMKRLKEIRPTD